MSSPDELARDTPPPFKRRKTRESLPPRSSSPDALANDPLDDDPRRVRTARVSQQREAGALSSSPSPSIKGSDLHLASLASSPESPARRPRRRSPSTRSPSASRSDSSAGSRTRFHRSPTRSRSGSPQSQQHPPSSSSTNPSPSASEEPPAGPFLRPREPPRPRYRARLVLHGHSRAVSQVRISPDGRFIASASADATVKIWDAATGAHMDTLVGHLAGVSCLAWTPDSNTLASGSDDKAIRLWDRVTGRPKTTARKASGREMAALRGHHNYIHCLAFSPKGNILASGSYDEAIFLWDVRAGRLMRSLPAHSDPVSGIDFCCDGTLVVSCSTDGLIRVWDTSTGQCLRTLVHEDNPAVTNVCFSPNGRFVLAFNLDNCIRLWDYVAGSVKKTYQGHVNSKFAIGGCFGRLDGEAFIVSASEHGDIVLWDVKNKGIIQRVKGHEGVCFWVDVHGDTMVSAGQDSTIRVYRHDRETGGMDGMGGAGDMRDEEMKDQKGNQDNEEEEHMQTAVLQDKLPIRQEDVKLEDA